MVEPEFIFTIPPVACLFGERENIARLYTSGWSSAIEFTLRSDSYGYGQDTVAQTWWVMHNLEADADAARAAAWAWYDRRLGPRCLTWSDDQVSEVERRLVDSTAEMPEALRG